MILDKKSLDFKTVLGEPFTGPFTVASRIFTDSWFLQASKTPQG